LRDREQQSIRPSAAKPPGACAQHPVTRFSIRAWAPELQPAEQNTTSSGLVIEDLEVGTGAEAKAGDTVSVHYTGTLTTGEKFDSSLDRGTPFSFTLGSGGVIKGWDEGVAGMKVGGKRKLTIPPELGYGAGGNPPVIPGNATLIFEIELMESKASFDKGF
jgi:FKBP-type peptidyl-prolyl cis-trans isomerase